MLGHMAITSVLSENQKRSHPQLLTEFEANLGYIGPCLGKKQRERWKKGKEEISEAILLYFGHSAGTRLLLGHRLQIPTAGCIEVLPIPLRCL